MRRGRRADRFEPGIVALEKRGFLLGSGERNSEGVFFSPAAGQGSRYSRENRFHRGVVERPRFDPANVSGLLAFGDQPEGAHAIPPDFREKIEGFERRGGKPPPYPSADIRVVREQVVEEGFDDFPGIGVVRRRERKGEGKRPRFLRSEPCGIVSEEVPASREPAPFAHPEAVHPHSERTQFGRSAHRVTTLPEDGPQSFPSLSRRVRGPGRRGA